MPIECNEIRCVCAVVEVGGFDIDLRRHSRSQAEAGFLAPCRKRWNV
jgi:hypothetical protein